MSDITHWVAEMMTLLTDHFIFIYASCVQYQTRKCTLFFIKHSLWCELYLNYSIYDNTVIMIVMEQQFDENNPQDS